MTTMTTATTTAQGATSQRRQLLLGLAARYPELRDLARAGRNVHEIPAPVELDHTDITLLAGLDDSEVQEARQRIYEDFAEVYQYGI